MIDVKDIQYRLIVVDSDGIQRNIRDYVTDLGWEHNEKEIASRISFTAVNEKVDDKYLSDFLKPGCLVAIYANDGQKDDEIVRGNIVDWKPSNSGGERKITIKAYDNLYDLQQSQDSVYYSAGSQTQAVITNLMEQWGLAYEYAAGSAIHEKLVFKAKNASDIITDILDDAMKKGVEKCLVSSDKGTVKIHPCGDNSPIYCFEADNSESITHTLSTSGMVTRVKVVAQADDEGRSSVEATLNGLTEYGIRQKIYTRDKDATLAEAQSAAQAILDEDGTVQETISVQATDIPWIKKGDVIHISADSLDGYYYVLGISHDIDTMSMTMQVKKAEIRTVEENAVIEKKDYKVGDIVNFHGGTHYVSSYPGAKGYPATPGPARIYLANGSGGAHPWSLIHTDNTSNVYGWVDDGTFD